MKGLVLSLARWVNKINHTHNVVYNLLQLFVKNIPSNMSPMEVSRLFAHFGKVHKFVQDPARKQVVYVLMNSENAQRAINSLHGKAIAKNCHPLVVEQSKEVSKLVFKVHVHVH